MTIPRQLPCSSLGRPAGVVGGICAALLCVGCASAPPSEDEIAYARSMSPSVELATTRTEELALEQADRLPAGEPVELGDGVVVPGPVYTAASGRRCREMLFGPSQRLACEDPAADVWVFVPDVFAAGPPTSGGESPGTSAAPAGTEGDERAPTEEGSS
jgi:hypothetical protein